MRSQNLILLLVSAAMSLLVACPPPGGGEDNNDAGADSGDVVEDAFELELGKSNQGEFEAFSGQPELEVVSGFQGGFHLEPAIRMDGLGRDEYFAIVTYSVVDTDTGQALHRSPSTYRVNESAFEREGSAWIRSYDRVILEVNTASDAAGREVELNVSVEIEGYGRASTFVTASLVDEIDETGG